MNKIEVLGKRNKCSLCDIWPGWQADKGRRSESVLAYLGDSRGIILTFNNARTAFVCSLGPSYFLPARPNFQFLLYFPSFHITIHRSEEEEEEKMEIRK